jgi:hypothetical protein
MTEHVSLSLPSGNTTVSISGPGGTVTVSSPSEKLAVVKNEADQLATKYGVVKAK